jgi:glycosyltransferase involved in cell wall biosynthesis
MARLGFVTLGADVPSTRFRFHPYLERLRREGHPCREWIAKPSVYDYYQWMGWRLSHTYSDLRRSLQVLDAHWHQPDAIYLERYALHIPSTKLDQQLRTATRRLVYDLDDAIFLTFPEKIPKLIRMSDHVVASNRLLLEYAQQFDRPVTMIPTSIDHHRFTPSSLVRDSGQADSRVPVVGWIGTGTNLPFLAVCAEALRKVAASHRFRLLVIAPSDSPLKPIDLSGVDLEFVPWSAASEVSQLQRMDIGLMPLPDEKPWMRYKAATKLVQYLSVGIPAIASPIGVNADILKGLPAAGSSIGVAASIPPGIGAQTSDQWAEALVTLLEDRNLRESMGRSGRQYVASQYSIEANYPILRQVLVPGVRTAS